MGELGREYYDARLKSIEDSQKKTEDSNYRRLDSHSAEIRKLSDISIEIMFTNKRITDLLEIQDARLKKLEDRIDQKPRWFETKIGEFTIKAAIAIIFLLLGAALGINAIDSISKI